jgi:hypothetical protein
MKEIPPLGRAELIEALNTVLRTKMTRYLLRLLLVSFALRDMKNIPNANCKDSRGLHQRTELSVMSLLYVEKLRIHVNSNLGVVDSGCFFLMSENPIRWLVVMKHVHLNTLLGYVAIVNVGGSTMM